MKKKRSLLTDFVESDDEESWKGYLYAFLLTVTATFLTGGLFWRKNNIVLKEKRTETKTSPFFLVSFFSQ